MLKTLNELHSRVSHRLLSCSKKSHSLVEILNMTTATPLLYRSVESVLKVFNEKEHKDVNGVQELLMIYDSSKEQKLKHDASGEIKKYPLIVLEGLDGSGKSTVGKRLAQKIKAVEWRTPPKSISHLRNLFDEHPVLRTAFYSLGNYIAALEVQLLLITRPVVMDRFWHSTAAYAIAQAVQDYPNKYTMPSKGDEIYSWPDDLFKPDIVLMLYVSESIRIERHARRRTVTTQEELLTTSTAFRNNVLLAYKNMHNPRVSYVNGDHSFGPVLKEIEGKIKSLFN